MKSIKKSFVLVMLAFVTLSLFVGCSQKPSNSEIEETVRAYLQNNVPPLWVGGLTGGKNEKINLIEIKEWGSFNKERKYWPVKIRVVGSAELNDPIPNQAAVSQFDRVAEFRFYKDDYGKWKASFN